MQHADTRQKALGLHCLARCTLSRETTTHVAIFDIQAPDVFKERAVCELICSYPQAPANTLPAVIL